MPNEFSTTIQKYTELLNSLLASEALSFNSDSFRARLPEQEGVYCVLKKIDGNFDKVYVGQSRNLRNRVYRNHLMGSRQRSTLKNKLIKSGNFSDEAAVKNYLQQQCYIQFVLIDNELDRNSFEHFAIALLRPRFNY